MYDGMWIRLHQDLRAVVDLLPEIAREICLILEEEGNKPYYLDRDHKLGGEYDMFGRIVWPMAHYGALELVTSVCSREGVQCSLPSEAVRCRQSWLDWLAEKGEAARVLALAEFDDRMLDQIDRYSRFRPDADLGDTLSVLDVSMFFAFGSELVWPEIEFQSRLEAALDVAKQRWLPIFLDAMRQGGYKDDEGEIYWPLAMSDFEEEEIPWLPQSFWWRHLPQLLKAAGRA